MYDGRQLGKGLFSYFYLFLILLEHSFEGIAGIALVNGQTDTVSSQALVHRLKELLTHGHINRRVFI